MDRPERSQAERTGQEDRRLSFYGLRDNLGEGGTETLRRKFTRLARELQTLKIAERVTRGEITYGQGERLAMFLDLERLGLAQTYHPKSMYCSRRRDATKLGYSANDHGMENLESDLTELLGPYLRTVETGSV